MVSLSKYLYPLIKMTVTRSYLPSWYILDVPYLHSRLNYASCDCRPNCFRNEIYSQLVRVASFSHYKTFSLLNRGPSSQVCLHSNSSAYFQQPIVRRGLQLQLASPVTRSLQLSGTFLVTYVLYFDSVIRHIVSSFLFNSSAAENGMTVLMPLPPPQYRY